jgi:RNA polymerase sigma-70 factor (ECF subfamily)
MNTGQPDTSIIQRVLQGEQTAYAELVDRYRNFVFTLILRYTDNREDAEEIAQDVFVKAWRSLSDFRGESRFSTWLYTIVRTSSITFLRKKRPLTLPIGTEDSWEESKLPASGFRADTVEQKSGSSLLNRAIRLLSPEDAQVLTLFYKGEQSLEEIGRIMGMEPNTAKVRLHRARLRLKEKMETYFPAEIAEYQK